ncbi:hypothetical protein EV648_11613 [Kribbella sp. VKM Ac-2568]|nr:hypothetical protein EV648_11613 [Kribbella sp. VKM Ac-2568]
MQMHTVRRAVSVGFARLGLAFLATGLPSTPTPFVN